jgi:hypothetical protein
MYTASCFIKKNNIKLREKMKSLGYNFSESLVGHPHNYIALFATGGCLIGIPKTFLNDKITKLIGNTNDCFNCKNNEDMFIALASLRDDTDENQWFILSNWIDENDKYVGDRWELCTCSTLEEHGIKNNNPDMFDRNNFKWRKASIQEIIKHFEK